MAEVQLSSKGNLVKPSAKGLHIDMTPLVDLAFLLITFFIFTTSMTEAKALKLTMLAGNEPTMPVRESDALTVLAGGGDTLYYYHGKWKKELIQLTSYDIQKGVGHIIRKKQEMLQRKGADVMFIIKPADRASYANLIDLLDEAAINNVKKYIVAPLSDEEKAIFNH